MTPLVLKRPLRSVPACGPTGRSFRRQGLRLTAPGRIPTAAEGFTLLELVSVMVIVGVLAAVALPNFLQATARAKAVEAKQGIHTRLLQAHATLNSGDADLQELLSTRISADPAATLAASQEAKFRYEGRLMGSIYQVRAEGLQGVDLAGKSLTGCIDLDRGTILMQAGFDAPAPNCAASNAEVAVTG